MGKPSRKPYRVAGGAAFTAILLLMAAGLGSAAAATRTSITIDNNFDTGLEEFWTTGGALCPHGFATTDFHFGTGTFHSRAFTFHLNKTLVCDGDAGSFTISVDAATNTSGTGDQGGWSVVGGDGPYAGMHGGGNLVGTNYTVGNGIIDLYTGVVTK